MREVLSGFLVGMSIGAYLMWFHFIRSNLIRTREEWYSGGWCRCCASAGYGSDIALNNRGRACRCPCHELWVERRVSGE